VANFCEKLPLRALRSSHSGAWQHNTMTSKLKRVVLSVPVLRPTVLYLYRTKIALEYLLGTIRKILVWLLTSNETANFTYHLEEKNKRYLAALIADITNKAFDEILGYIDEIMNDSKLQRHIAEMTRRNDARFTSDPEAKPARRAGWYAFVRALKPKIVVETGVDKGLGACVLTSALMKNIEEGYEGYYYGTDINPKAGYLMSDDYRKFGEILYGDSIESLRKLDKEIDIFINDSDHSAEYERREYETIKAKLSPNAIILGDNAHVDNKLLDFALATGRRFIFFQERPLNHWYPGAGIGIAFVRNS
jgi:predicted O-methyltransferase YrrM